MSNDNSSNSSVSGNENNPNIQSTDINKLGTSSIDVSENCTSNRIT